MKEIIQKCKKCGKDIERPDPRRLYCFKCSAIMQREYKKTWILNNPEKVRQSKDNANRKKRERLATNAKYNTCPICGNTFRKMGSEIYCQGNCRKTIHAKREKLRHIPKTQRNGTDIECILCGKIFTRNAHNEKYCIECKKRIAVHRERRRALQKKRVEGTHTRLEFYNLCSACLWKCVYCGKELNMKTVTEDHIVPLAHGGSDNISNIALACLSCNCSKSDSSVYDFMKRKQCSLEI